jgi:hypothetical protein
LSRTISPLTFFKRAMLENTVYQVPELQSIKVQANQHKTQTSKDLTMHQQHCTLLSSAAYQHDDHFAQSNLKTKNRTLCQHDIAADEPYFNIDLDISDATDFFHGPCLQRQQ